MSRQRAWHPRPVRQGGGARAQRAAPSADNAAGRDAGPRTPRQFERHDLTCHRPIQVGAAGVPVVPTWLSGGMSEMTYRPLGSSGLMVSTIGLGTNAFGARIDAEQTQRVVDAALDAGITFFDTSDTYGVGASEELLGRSLGSRRDDVVVATKFGMDMGGANGPDWGARASRRYVRRAVEASLRRLGTDHIDLYQLHQPDLVTPI